MLQYASCAAEGDASAIPLPPPAIAVVPGLQIAYGTELYRTPTGDRPAPTQPGPGDLPAWLRSTDPDRSASEAAERALSARGPGVFAGSQALCIQNQPPFYFDFEAGLRLRYCLPAINTATDDLRRGIAAMLAGTPGSLPLLEINPIHAGSLESGNHPGLRVFASTPGRLRQSIAPVLISADGFRRPVLSRWRLSGSQARFAYTSSSYGAQFGAANTVLPLPRRFPGAEHAILVGADEIHWLYQSPANPDTLLVIAIHDAQAARLLHDTLARLPEFTAREIARAASPGQFLVGEAYFRTQRGQHRPLSRTRADEFLELHTDAPAFAQIRIHGDATIGPGLEQPLFLFAHSTWLVEREQAPGLRWNQRFEFHYGKSDETEAISRSYQLPALAPAARSLEFPHGGHPSVATITRHCRADLLEYAELCAHPGLSPAFAQILRRLPAAEYTAPANPNAGNPPPECLAGDFTLSEINPTGISIPPDRIDNSGKFVELRVARRCRSGRVLFRAGPALLDPGTGRILRPEQPLLFLVDPTARRFFDLPLNEPGVALGFAPALRNLTLANLRLTAIELPASGSDVRQIREIPVAGLTADMEYWSGSGRAFRTGDAFRAVHSLGPLARAPAETQPAATPTLGFAHGPGQGLRPDLIPHNAMSPGRFARPGGDLPRVQLAEVLPAGERLADGSSRPGAEFVELRLSTATPQSASFAAQQTEFAALSLSVHAQNGGRFHALLPHPEFTGDIQSSRPVLIRESSACFADAARDRAYALPALRLPDGPAIYQLRALPSPTLSSSAAYTDRLVISTEQYAALSPKSTPATNGSPRRSHARSFIEESGMAFSGPIDRDTAISPLCGASTQATPGRSGGFAPRLLELPLPDQSAFPAERRLQLYSEAGPLWIEWQTYLPEPHTDSNILDRGPTAHAITGAGGPVRLLSGGSPLWITAPPVPGVPTGIRQLVRSGFSGSGHSTSQHLSLYTGELFAQDPALYVERVAATPAAGQHEWLRLCSTGGLPWPAASAQLQLRDRSSTDTIVPARERFAAGLTLPPDAPPLSQSARELSPGTCAIVVDPDYNGHALPWLPADRALWTIASSTAIGNGLSADEAVNVFWRLPAISGVPAAACPGDPDGRCYSLSRYSPGSPP